MSKSLIIYFSRADENYAVGYITKGNTQIVAEYVQELTGADMFKVEPAVPYARDYNTCIREAKQRIGNAPIKEKLTDISAYETVFIMSPIYWGTYAPEVETALEGLDFAVNSSCRNTNASTSVMITLSLSMGTTLDAWPICSAL